MGRRPPPAAPKTCAETVVRTSHYGSEAHAFAQRAGLNISAVSWEDNARTKNSCWGPCISDMTLEVESLSMPLIKASSNFEDETWDIEIDKIPLVVGNEDGTMLRTVTLKEYLKNFRDYLHAPNKWPGTAKSLLVDGKDQHVITSAQACFLPMPAEGDAKFNIAIRNYQSRAGDPAVLAIVASANGTSAQVLDSSSKMHLYHNNNGQRASFIGQRVSDYRRETGSELAAGAALSESEKQQNMLLVIQVPLKQRSPPPSFDDMLMPCAAPMNFLSASSVQSCRVRRSAAVDVEAAIVKVGEDEGPYTEINDIKIERDERFPIRVTMQFYKATSNGAVNDAVMSSIAEELQGARKWAVAISSLVTETTNRTTEHTASASIQPPPPTAIVPPSWWNAFWAEYGTIYGNWSANAARDKLFANGRFANSNIDQVREQVLDILGKGPDAPPFKPAPQLPSWNVL